MPELSAPMDRSREVVDVILYGESLLLLLSQSVTFPSVLRVDLCGLNCQVTQEVGPRFHLVPTD